MPSRKHSGLDTTIKTLGPAKITSPLTYCHFIRDEPLVPIRLLPEDLDDDGQETDVSFQPAGPRENTYFDPSKAKAAIVTCGGLCPGINDVIRAIVMEAHHNYNMAATLGIRFGLQGFIPSYGHQIMELTPSSVANIHEFGGTVLGTSRGPQAPEDIVDALERLNIGILFIIGGDGSLKAARKIHEEVTKRQIKIAVIGIPKTIDNDISLVPTSFGFDTAVDKSTEAIRCAHTEALGAVGGIGMVKLMGRESGFIAAQAALALKDVNYVLVPEDPFQLTGPNGLLPDLETRLKERGHAVIVVAEGAGQHLLQQSGQTDASGNPILGDIASLLSQQITNHFRERSQPMTLKYIDPSYIIRSVPANSNDRVYCGFLGQFAVHAAMAGKTGMVVSRVYGRYVHLPLELATRRRKRLDLTSDYWRAVLESTGQYTISPMPRKGSPGCAC